MKKVTIHDWGVGEVMDVVKELRNRGYVQGKDFDFEYHKPKYSDTTYELVYNRHTIFTFYTDSLATWFVLSYQ